MKPFKRLVNFTLASLLISVGVFPAIAEQPSPPPPNGAPNGAPPPHPNADRPGMDPLELLQLEQVQKELALTPEQIAKLKQFAEQHRPPQNQRTRGLGQPMPDMAQQAEATRQGLEKILDQEQLNRLRGFLIQANGFTPEFISPRTRGNAPADPLKLTAEQQKKLATIQKQSQQSARAIIEAPRTRGSSPANTCKQLEALKTKSNQEMLSVLSKEQQAALEQLKGPKLNLPARSCNP